MLLWCCGLAAALGEDGGRWSRRQARQRISIQHLQLRSGLWHFARVSDETPVTGRDGKWRQSRACYKNEPPGWQSMATHTPGGRRTLAPRGERASRLLFNSVAGSLFRFCYTSEPPGVSMHTPGGRPGGSLACGQRGRLAGSHNSSSVAGEPCGPCCGVLRRSFWTPAWRGSRCVSSHARRLPGFLRRRPPSRRCG
jgi:hypothetical protein